ncbi:GTP-binding protein [Bacillus testis]|uniref:GTP-binding protein n=1 Tax=Bacillus testis TaxID=1622072 RepID=UPI00067F3862|nr:TetM/TetW/TetO/TetS family tetracycline resistance ribosomal protection protein [Bacillus testis]
MKKTIGVLAHVDAGKTTFAEQLLYHTNSIKQRGRVDHRDAFLDCHEIEKERGITVFAEQGIMSYNGSTYYLIDTPGHVDFSPEMERSVQVMDYAIVIVSAVEGVRGHTETVWQLLRKHKVPTFFFINKMDRTGADVEKVLDEIRNDLTPHACDVTTAFHKGEMREELIEFLAERDEGLFDAYLEKGYEPDIWLNAMVRLVKEGKVFPCCSGSALMDQGISDFLEKMDRLTETAYSVDSPFSAIVYKIRHDEQAVRTTFLKVLSGKIQVRDDIHYRGKMEKVTGLRKYNGRTYEQVNHAEAGDLIGVIGITSASVGEGIGSLLENARYEMIPALKSKVKIGGAVHPREALKCFRMLGEEDPSLNVIWEERHQEIHIHVMGMIQLEVLKKIIKDRFRFEVEFEEPTILYKESIAGTAFGYGHFEPLGHYAEVHLRLEPGERGSGIVWENECHANDLSIGNQNLVRHHLLEKEHSGLLTGSPLTDMKVTLLTGKAHNKHTSGGDFREATLRALRQGLEKTESILLEPYYSFKIKVGLDQLGRVLSDIQSAHGTFDAPLTEGEKAVITGKAPVSTFMAYSMELASFTQGTGTISMKMGGYGSCHNPEEVKERIGYDKNADPDYSSSSIFCSKGQAYSVDWMHADEQMHAK